MLKKITRSLLCLAWVVLALSSCSTYERLSLQLKYRGEYRQNDIHKQISATCATKSANKTVEEGIDYMPSLNSTVTIDETPAPMAMASTPVANTMVQNQTAKAIHAVAQISAKAENGEIRLTEAKKQKLRKIENKWQAKAAKGEGGYHWAALVGFISALSAVLLLFVPGTQGALLFAILGLIFSAIGLGKTGSNKAKGKGFAIAGLVISILYFLLFIVAIVALAAFLGAAV